MPEDDPAEEAAKNIPLVLEIITDFNDECAQQDYTDSGRAWEVLDQIFDLLGGNECTP